MLSDKSIIRTTCSFADSTAVRGPSSVLCRALIIYKGRPSYRIMYGGQSELCAKLLLKVRRERRIYTNFAARADELTGIIKKLAEQDG